MEWGKDQERSTIMIPFLPCALMKWEGNGCSRPIYSWESILQATNDGTTTRMGSRPAILLCRLAEGIVRIAQKICCSPVPWKETKVETLRRKW